jgi:predicted amidophosphoribosyltransferase
MRNRHIPRLCRSCDSPMASEQNSCWSCGAPWQDRSGTDSTLSVSHGDRVARRDDSGAEEPSDRRVPALA